MDDLKKVELGDDDLDTVVGGYEIGQKGDAIVGVLITARSAASCC